MHRNISDLTRRIERALEERLRPAAYRDVEPVRIAATHLPGEPIAAREAMALDYAPFDVGAAWGRPWGTTWFRFTGTVPQRMVGERVELLVDLGFGAGTPGFLAEGLAWTRDGMPIKGVEPRTGYVPIVARATGGETFEIYVEAAANPTFDGQVSDRGDVETAPDVLLYRLERAELAVLDEQAWGLALDVQVLHQLAEQLADGDPRRHEIRRALEVALDDLGAGADAAGARAVLAPCLSAPAVASAHRVSAVGHAHIDSAWLWPMRETRRKCARTFSNVVALADDYPELVFACSSAQQYAWMREQYPQLYQRIVEKVSAGQFVPVGGMWVEFDTNMPGGEALVRQFVHGKRFFAQEFGVEPREVWLPDSFGYTAALPQLCRLAGFRWFLTQKMSWNQTDRFPHHTFWWEGIDGTRIFTHFPPADTYNSELSGAELAHGVRNFSEHGRATRSLLPFGYGDGGGGPTREMLEIARRTADLEGSPRVTVESAADFFTAAEGEYPDAPVWSGEMYLEFHRGTYTSQAAMKQGNRRTEHLLREAELWCATASVRRGRDYPYEQLDSLWQQALLHQFHDILPGSSIAWVHREARATYARLAAELEAVIEPALADLVGPGETRLVANAAPHKRSGIAALGVGTRVPATGAVQVVQDGAGLVLDNGLLRVRIDNDGTLNSVRDLAADREVLAGPAGVLQLHPDQPNRWDAWDLDDFYRHRMRALVDEVALEVDAGDPSRATVRFTRTDGKSRYTQQITLAAGSVSIEFETTVDWHERDTLLKVAFPLDVHADHSSAEIQFGHVRRPTHVNTSWDAARFEICAHRWLHVGEHGYGVALVNDGKYGHDVTRRAPGDGRGAAPTSVRLSLLRGPSYPDPHTDEGEHRMRYALVCGASIPDAVRAGYRANLPERDLRGGAPVAALVDVRGEGVVVEAMKLADDRSGDVVVRLYESLGGRTRAHVDPSFAITGASVCDLLERADDTVASLAPLVLDGDIVTVDLAPFQVVTLRLSR